MDLTDRWKAMNWQTTEFSYAKVDLLTKLKKESKSDITQLLKAYKRLYASTLALTAVTPLFALLKPDDPEYLFSIGLIWSYCLILSGFLTVKFIQFKLPDLSLKPVEAVRASLAFVRSINSFQVNFLVLYTPLIFLGSLLGTLTYRGRTFTQLMDKPLVLIIIIVSTISVIALSRILRRFMASRQCVALIAKLEEHLLTLEQQ